MTELIVFDLDGTLINSMGDIAASVNRMRESFGLAPLPVPEITAMTGNGAVTLTERALKDTGCDVTEGVRRWRQFYADHLVESTTLYDGVAQGLAAMKERSIRLAVVTNKPTSHAKSILHTLKVDHLLDEIWGGDSGFPLKPDPTALLAFQKSHGARKENCWMLGDHYTDLGAGRQAGFQRGFARWGFGEVRDEQFDREFENFAAFTAAVTEQ